MFPMIVGLLLCSLMPLKGRRDISSSSFSLSMFSCSSIVKITPFLLYLVGVFLVFVHCPLILFDMSLLVAAESSLVILDLFARMFLPNTPPLLAFGICLEIILYRPI